MTDIRLQGVGPIRFWLLKRRAHGGVRDGAPEVAVLETLGQPAERAQSDEGQEWRYLIGSSHTHDVHYSVLINDGHVRASWWSSVRRTA